MANEDHYNWYDADGDVTRYLLDPTTDIAMFSEPPVVRARSPPPSSPIPRRRFTSSSGSGPLRMLPGGQQQQPHPAPGGLDLRSDEIHALKQRRRPPPNPQSSSPPEGLLGAANPDRPDDDELDAILSSFRDEAAHGDSGGGVARVQVLPVEQDANLVPSLPLRHGQLDCSRCHLVRHVMHVAVLPYVKFSLKLVWEEAFHRIRRMYVISVRSNVYSLSKWTQEWASEFIARNIDTMRNNTNGQLLDSGYSNLVESVRTNVNVPHTAVEVNLLQTIMSAPSADHHQNAADQVAAPAAQPFSAAPPVALPPKAAPRKARKDRDYASMLVAVEEFYVAATSRPVPNSDVEILESSHVSQQQDGGRAIIYPSLQARRGKTKQEVPRRNAKDVLEYLSLARKETEKEINTLSSFDGIYRNDGTLSYLMTEVRRLNRKIWRLQKNAPSTLSSRLLASVKEIDDIKVEKGRLYAQFISALKKLCRKKMDDGGSAPSANN
ncbi:hypothetical protein OsJ_26791 [Oryza sativa Japonica Group]|uniref:Uncharacterized protein n=2 Tax=Oryza sativa subsp. japonica TaxID=39947 RepID=A3BRN8_ORYSJ|nr:hypothetical protein OsJ_26791 [Oryza sativa Japonica Group]